MYFILIDLLTRNTILFEILKLISGNYRSSGQQKSCDFSVEYTNLKSFCMQEYFNLFYRALHAKCLPLHVLPAHFKTVRV